jgi:hypothetical protein
MKVELVEIDAVPDSLSSRWKVRALAIDDASPALAALDGWLVSEKADFKKIIKSLRFAAATQRVTDEKFVKKSANSDDGNVYEARADKGHARLMFFYCEEEKAIVCTNSFWKNRDNQNVAFTRCARFKELFEKHRNERKQDRKEKR